MSSRGKKEAIEQAAIRLFALKGPAATTIKDIAEHSGVTEGALYRHYTSKEAMLTELFIGEQEKMRDLLIAAFERDLPLEAKLRGVIAAIYDHYAADPYSSLFVLLNFQSLQGVRAPGLTGHIYDFFIERAKGLMAGLPRPFSEVTVTLLVGLIMEPILFHHHGRLPEQPAAYLEAVTRACCRVLDVPDEAILRLQ